MPDTTEWAVIDTETTGLGPGARAVEIAVVVLDADLAEVSSWTSIIDPEIPVGASEVHGLGCDDISGAPPFAGVAAAVESMLAGRNPVGHNLRFDWNVLRREFRRLGVSVPHDHRGACTAALGERHFGRRERLATLCERLGFAQEGAHEALSDARSAAEVFRRLRGLGIESPRLQPLAGFARSWTLPRSIAAAPRPSSIDRDGPLPALRVTRPCVDRSRSSIGG